MADLPAQVSSGKYLAIYTAGAVLKVLEIPEGRCALVFDGQDVRFVDGSDSQPFLLPNLEEQEGGSLPCILAMTAAGQVMRFAPNTVEEGAGNFTLRAIGGVMKWEQDGSASGSLPTGGVGVLTRKPDGSIGYIGSASIKGLFYINGNGVVTVIENAAVGTYLQMGSAGPFFGGLGGGSAVVSGADSASSGIERIQAYRKSTTEAQFAAPALLAFDAGGSSVKITNFSAGCIPSDGVVEGGLDTGTMANSTWYHVYAITDGASQVSCVASLSITAPDLTGMPAGYTHYAYIGAIYVKSNGDLRDFFQKGRRVMIEETLFGNNLNIGTTFAAITGSVNLNTIVPPNVRLISGTVGGSSAETASRIFEIASTSGGMGRRIFGNVSHGTENSFKLDIWHFEDLMIVDSGSPAIYWKVSNGGGAVTGKRRITIDGYVF